MRDPLVFYICLMIWLLLGAFYLRHKRYLKRLHSKPPDEVINILKQLPEGWQLLSYRWPEDMEWEAELGVDDRRFRLFSDQGRICEAEIVKGKTRYLAQRMLKDTLIPQTIVERLVEASKM
jgi:hypothetical protein